jgi:hypothetical protein
MRDEQGCGIVDGGQEAGASVVGMLIVGRVEESAIKDTWSGKVWWSAICVMVCVCVCCIANYCSLRLNVTFFCFRTTYAFWGSGCDNAVRCAIDGSLAHFSFRVYCLPPGSQGTGYRSYSQSIDRDSLRQFYRCRASSQVSVPSCRDAAKPSTILL